MKALVTKPVLVLFRRAACCVVGLLSVVGVVHTGTVWLVSRALFRDAANGSLVTRNGVVVGSRLIGQAFSGDAYFHPRPSAAGGGYDALASSGTNLGPTNAKLRQDVSDLARQYRLRNLLPHDAPLPADAVTRSGSGLDPHIGAGNARLQVARVARARGLESEAVRALVESETESPVLGVFGEPRINVLSLNLALDDLTRRQREPRRAGSPEP